MTAPYKFINGCQIQRISDSFVINSNDPRDPSLQAYQDWAAQGNVPDPEHPPVIPIPSITTRQFLIQAAAQSLLTANEALAAATTNTIPTAIAAVFNALPADQKLAAQITWAKMTAIDRDDDLVLPIATAFGLDSAKIDAFFIAAAAL